MRPSHAKTELAILFDAVMRGDIYKAGDFASCLARHWDLLVVEYAKEMLRSGSDPDIADATGEPVLKLRHYTGDDINGDPWHLELRIACDGVGDLGPSGDLVLSGIWSSEWTTPGRCPRTPTLRLPTPEGDVFPKDIADELATLLFELADLPHGARASS